MVYAYAYGACDFLRLLYSTMQYHFRIGVGVGIRYRSTCIYSTTVLQYSTTYNDCTRTVHTDSGMILYSSMIVVQL